MLYCRFVDNLHCFKHENKLRRFRPAGSTHTTRRRMILPTVSVQLARTIHFRRPFECCKQLTVMREIRNPPNPTMILNSERKEALYFRWQFWYNVESEENFSLHIESCIQLKLGRHPQNGVTISSASSTFTLDVCLPSPSRMRSITYGRTLNELAKNNVKIRNTSLFHFKLHILYDTYFRVPRLTEHISSAAVAVAAALDAGAVAACRSTVAARRSTVVQATVLCTRDLRR